MFGKLKKLFGTEQEQPKIDWFEEGSNLIKASENETNPEKKQKLFTQGYDIILREAENGDTRAMIKLSSLFLIGDHCPADPEKAFYWCEQSVKAGDIESMVLLGNFYINGVGTEENIEQAFYWYTEGANHGDYDAYCTMASLYDDSGYIPSDEEKALQYMQMYCNAIYNNPHKLNPSDVMLEFAKYYNINDDKRYAKWIERSADLGNAAALILYFSDLLVGKHAQDSNDNEDVVIVQADYKKAKYYLEQAAKLDVVLAFYYLAEIYANGLGTDRNQELANYWYHKSIEQGNIKELYRIGYMSRLDDNNFKRNLPFAIACFTKAAELIPNNRDDDICRGKSMVWLGLIYIFEEGHKDLKLAMDFWSKAAEIEMPDGLYNLGILYENLSHAPDAPSAFSKRAKDCFARFDDAYKKVLDLGLGEHFTYLENLDWKMYAIPNGE